MARAGVTSKFSCSCLASGLGRLVVQLGAGTAGLLVYILHLNVVSPAWWL